MESPEATNINLFQQIGQIQGTLNALIKNLSDFQSEFRLRTTDQDKNLEKLRQELNTEIKELATKVDALEEFRANYEGAKAEAKRNARLTGGTTGGIVGILVTGLLSLINYLVHTLK